MSEIVLDNGADELQRTEKKNNKDIYGWIQIAIVVLIILLIGFGIGQYVPRNTTDSVNLENISNVVYSGTECSLRSTPSVVWIPNMIVQSDADGNITGVPICIPIDRNSGFRIKNS
jgi:hypothetical protein